MHSDRRKEVVFSSYDGIVAPGELVQLSTTEGDTIEVKIERAEHTGGRTIRAMGKCATSPFDSMTFGLFSTENNDGLAVFKGQSKETQASDEQQTLQVQFSP